MAAQVRKLSGAQFQMQYIYELAVCACVLSRFSSVQLFATLWTVACHVPPPMGFSRQEYQSGLPCPPPGDRPELGIKPASPASLALADAFFTSSATWEAPPQLKMANNQLYIHESRYPLDILFIDDIFLFSSFFQDASSMRTGTWPVLFPAIPLVTRRTPGAQQMLIKIYRQGE